MRQNALWRASMSPMSHCSCASPAMAARFSGSLRQNRGIQAPCARPDRPPLAAAPASASSRPWRPGPMGPTSFSMKALIWLSGTAPMKPSTGWPLLKAMTAGIDWMPELAGDLRVLVDIHLDQLDLAAGRLDDLLDDRGQAACRVRTRAPRNRPAPAAFINSAMTSCAEALRGRVANKTLICGRGGLWHRPYCPSIVACPSCLCHPRSGSTVRCACINVGARTHDVHC